MPHDGSSAPRQAIGPACEFEWLRTPFPSRLERIALATPAVPLLVTAAIFLLATRGESSFLVVPRSESFDLFFAAVTLAMVLSSFLTAAWWRSLPEFFGFLCTRRLRDPTTALSISDELRRRLCGPWRLGIVAFTIAISAAFAPAFTAELSRRVALSWWGLVLVWGWILGSANAVVIAVALAMHRIGRDGALIVRPEHPDGCGGLRFVGDALARMGGPLLVISMVMAFAAADARLGAAALRALTDVVPLEPYSTMTDAALRHELAASVADERLQRQKHRCAELEETVPSAALTTCVRELARLANDAHSARLDADAAALRWRPRVVWAARVGLLGLVFSAIVLFFLAPLWSIHQAMEAAQREREEGALDAISAAERTLMSARAQGDAALVEEAARSLADLRRHAREMPRIVWPFDRALLAKATVPQLVTAGWGIARALLWFG
jgi:hypothetical protein